MSEYLLHFMNLVQFLLILIAVMALMVLLALPTGKMGIAAILPHLLEQKDVFAPSVDTGISAAARCFFIITILYLCLPSVYIVRQVCKLLACFQAGDIFNVTALQHARRAYRINLYFSVSSMVLYLCLIVVVMVMTTGFQIDFLGNWFFTTFTMLIELSVVSLVLWSLEYGTDLHEETELTI